MKPTPTTRKYPLGAAFAAWSPAASQVHRDHSAACCQRRELEQAPGRLTGLPLMHDADERTSRSYINMRHLAFTDGNTAVSATFSLSLFHPGYAGGTAVRGWPWRVDRRARGGLGEWAGGRGGGGSRPPRSSPAPPLG